MMKNQLAGLMKQAQQMQDNMKKMQDELALVEVEGQSGAGLVKVTMTCKNDVRRVTIDPSLLADDNERHDGRHADAAGFQAAVLSCRSKYLNPQSIGFQAHETTFRLVGARRSAARAAGRGSQVGAAHGLSPDAARSAGR